MRRLIAVLVLAGAAVVAWRVFPAGGAPLDPPMAPPSRRIPTRFALGINEAVSVPQRFLRDGTFAGDTLAKHLAEDARRARGLGARFVRGNTGAFPRTSWWASQNEPGAAADADAWVRAVQAEGLEPILMVSPWPGNRTANVTDHYLPDMKAYTPWVQALVERYDGDGVDDMPGLTAPVRYWEVDNEPDLKFTAAPRASSLPPSSGGGPGRGAVKPGTFCTPAEAAAVLVATSGAIRAAYPDAIVLDGGLFRPFASSGQDYLRAMLAVPGATAAFDVLSLHTYASDAHGDTLARGIRATRAIAGDRPVWVTETSVASEGNERWMDPEWQGRMVATSAARAAVEGATLVLWHSLADPPVDRKTGFEHHSLLSLSADGLYTEKPAAAVFRNLAARLAEDDLTAAVPDGDGAVRLASGAVLLYEGDREAPKGGLSLRTGEAIAPGGAAQAPAWLWP